ncbi:MAG: host attachment protein [Acetobacteraceae bacterium]
MVQHHHLCFVIADGGQARLVMSADDNALHTVEHLESEALHKRSSDLTSDRPGRSFESASPTRHAVEPRNDPHEMEKIRFAHIVGERIKEAGATGRFNELVLVAPPNVLAEMMSMLDKPTEAKVIGTLAKDLVKVPDHELYPHLKQWVRPTHRA